MAFSTNASPVYGGGTLVVEFPADSPLAQDASYYLVYEGRQQRHVTTARILSASKLHSIVPGHQEAEEVQINVLCFHGDDKRILATSDFHFHNESAYYLAQYLVESVYSPDSLVDLELIKSDNFDLADEELSSLDQRLSRALAHLDFPDFWSVLGPDYKKDDTTPRTTVFHFAAQLGLSRVAAFFIKKPDSEIALSVCNKNGDTPKDVALANQHNGLAELLSEYNSNGLMPVGRWFETDRGVVQTRETGDVTLTSNLQNHKRTVEEDIIVLNGIQKQLEDDDVNVALQWQTPWPENQAKTSDNTNTEDSSDETFKAICEKAQELPNIVSIETVSDYRDNNDTYTDPNIEGLPMQDSTVEYSDEGEVAMDTGQLPRLHVSEGEEEMETVMEEGISNLHEYNQHLLRIREKSTVFNRLLEQSNGRAPFVLKKLQDLRLEKLARFSSSCPSLDTDNRDSPLPVIDEADHHKSMVDLAEDGSAQADNVASPTCYNGDHNEPHTRHLPSDVHVIVDGATTDSSTDYGLKTQEYDEFLKEFYGGNVPQTRRRSYSPKQSAQDNDNESCSSAPNMLIHGNKSVNIIPSDGEDTDDESFQPDTDTSASDSFLSGGSGRLKRATYSSGDIDDIAEDDNSLIEDSRNEGRSPDDAVMSKKSGRGQPNPSRYSADIEKLMRQGHHSGSLLERLGSHLNRSATTEESSRALGVPHNKMTKALSTSSIPAATNAEKHRGAYKGLNQSGKHAQFHRQDEIEEEDPPNQLPAHVPLAGQRKKAQISLYDFLNDSSNFSTDYQPGQLAKIKDKEKEEKKRKTSVFSRLQSSYRIKKSKDKEGKHKVSHRFVPLSTSNAIPCDICNKPLSNKPALRCEICLVNVHDSSCKEHVTPCDKGKPKSQTLKQFSGDGEVGYNGQEKNSTMGVSNLRPSFSFKDKSSSSSRPQSSYVGGSTQPLPMTQPLIQPEVQQETAVPLRKRRSGLQTAAIQNQRRSLPNPRIVVDNSFVDKRSRSKSPRPQSDKAKSNRAIAEEGETDPAHTSRLDLGQSNITETNSHSIESLDEVDSVHEVGYDDVELGRLEVEEPETWSETVDKKVLKKLHTKDIKRQDTIWELIQTERQYCKRLKTLEIFFRNAMIKENMPSIFMERMFPRLDDLVRIHMQFFRKLKELQNRKADSSIDELGPTLYEQFYGETGNQMKAAYGVFCSGHLEAVQLYKDLMAKDRKFLAFIKMRMNHPLCKKREIPDFILLITQRPTKYPILIEAVIKSTKDKKDRELLLKVLDLSKDVLQSVNEQVLAAEMKMKLKEIFTRLESRTFAFHRGKKFRKTDIIANGRKLLYEGMVWWKNGRGKNIEVLGVVLTDVMFFLQENNQKYIFFSQDNKNAVVSLYNLLVREKRDTRDTRGIYLISQTNQAPVMYEIVFNSASDMQKWAAAIRTAVENCPEVEEENDDEQREADEEKRRADEKQARAKYIMEKLKEKDEEIHRCCDAKNKLMDQLFAVYNETEEQQQHSRPSSRDFDEMPTQAENSGALQAAIQEVSLAATQLTSMLQDPGTGLSRSVSSVGEHNSNTFQAVSMPKRAETFGGFDTNHERGKHKPDEDAPDLADPDISRDHSEADLGHIRDLAQQMNPRVYDSESESGHGSSPGAYSTGSTLSPMATSSQEQINVAHLLKTLHSIVHLTSRQGTAVETLRCQLAEANERINKLSADVHEKRGPGYKHNQLEELRNLQGVIQKEKEDWEKKKEKERQIMEYERAQIDDMRHDLDKQEADIKQQKEELAKKREMLQRQTDLLRQSGQLPKDEDVSDNTTEVQSNFVPGHRRSASAESFNNPSDEPKKSSTGSNTSIKESFRVDNNKSSSKLQSFSYSNKANVPEHLLSATNEQKIGPKNVQKLPSKLLSSGLSGTSGSQSDLRKTQTNNSSATHSAPGGHLVGNQGNQSSPALHREQESVPMNHSQSAGQLGNQGQGQGQPPLGSSVTVPKGSWQSNRPKPSAVSGLGGVMKLSEKGDKKAKSSQSKTDKGAQSSSPQQVEKTGQSGQRPKSGTPGSRNTNVNHKPQKSDSDVIYF